MKKLFILLLSLCAFNSLAAPVNVNSADAKTIADALTGIGLKKAEAIVKYREEHGLFKTPEDLLDISGIGEKTLEKIKPDLLFDAQSLSADTKKAATPQK